MSTVCAPNGANSRDRRLHKLGEDVTLYGTMTATLTSRGQLTIPAAERRRLGLRTGSRVRYSVFAEAQRGPDASGNPSKQHPDAYYEPTLPITALKGLFPKPEKAATLEDMEKAIGCGGEEGKWPGKKSPVSAIKGFFPKPERAVTLEEMDEAIGCGRKQKW